MTTVARNPQTVRRYDNEPIAVGITGLRFEGDMAYFQLTDGREVGIPLDAKYMGWLKNATPEQRAKWRILGPDGWAVEWPAMEEGVEVEHLLLRHPF